jgi:hypothetical protein
MMVLSLALKKNLQRFFTMRYSNLQLVFRFSALCFGFVHFGFEKSIILPLQSLLDGLLDEGWMPWIQQVPTVRWLGILQACTSQHQSIARH